MNAEPPILESELPGPDQDRLIALFDELEKGQLTFLDEAGKRIVEFSTAAIGLIFAVAAFGDRFPPPYLAGNGDVKVLFVLALAFYLAAIGLGAWAIQPRRYRRYTTNLTAMREELEKMRDHKSRWVEAAGLCFGLGALSLVALIVSIVLRA